MDPVILGMLAVIIVAFSVSIGASLDSGSYSYDSISPGSVLGGIVGIGLSIALITWMVSSENEAKRAYLEKEIGWDGYRTVEDLRGSDCRIDRRIALAMENGRISNREYGVITKLYDAISLARTKASIAGEIAKGACAADKPTARDAGGKAA